MRNADISAELLVTKLQYIRGVDEGLVTDDDAHRIIGRLSKKVVLMGPEDKDLIDVCAVLVDCPPGAPIGGLDLAAFGTHLRNDWRLAKTVRLNLENEGGVLTVLEGRGVEGAPLETRIPYDFPNHMGRPSIKRHTQHTSHSSTSWILRCDNIESFT